MEKPESLLPVSEAFDWPSFLAPVLRLASKAADPDDPPDLTFRKVTATAWALFLIPVPPLSALGAFLQGQPQVALMLLPVAVGEFIAVGALLYARGWFNTVIRLSAFLNQLVSLALTLQAGGFVSSGANNIWGVFGPMLVGLFISPKEGAYWFAGFALATVATIVVDPAITSSDVGPAVFVTNVVFGFTVVFACLMYFEVRRRQTEQRLHEQRQRADALLHNVLPDSIVDRLKDGETQLARRFEDVSVCFIDLVGFTPLSASLPPERVVALLDGLFKKLDAAVARHGVEKIKTIGDAYMVAAGVPEPRDDHLQAITRFALEARQIIADTSLEGHEVTARIGLHAGPVVAGIIGDKRFAYDLWGDTVNTASRMESSGVPGHVQCTADVAQRLGDRFAIDPRGTIEVKGKGPVEVAWVQRVAAEAS